MVKQIEILVILVTLGSWLGKDVCDLFNNVQQQIKILFNPVSILEVLNRNV